MARARIGIQCGWIRSLGAAAVCPVSNCARARHREAAGTSMDDWRQIPGITSAHGQPEKESRVEDIPGFPLAQLPSASTATPHTHAEWHNH
ncbi:hypothetical protein GE21DRAFT_1183 [Neurospora crassa]|uniref:Uncharacterized protein n=1 Tax=Neurospora crassa (strain ATCC 24698 / 74-OR23-1A / CBS 708.71 / DSM 1257 / FGSC 987) TaxID=367110 RepID=Q7SDV1_NEUCR|nr:hypothetical protein rat-1 [Neurospora crassa OR74A]EAA34953.1 hypothetical protein rat-1 [Neurospora crassa OR74A]KHE85991.1 hypothetical protein GE21DRAFT_1183 [Neurospora crassa]|eukprot:XP_964189.1 hypothetical protein rat-1 [Neurospora crassa OR74A]